jgi:hypothetical protein
MKSIADMTRDELEFLLAMYLTSKFNNTDPKFDMTKISTDVETGEIQLTKGYFQ